MAKRKFIQDDNEDAQDSDFKDTHDHDKPSSADNGEERVSTPTLRVTRSKSKATKAAQQDQDDEEGQEQNADGAGDAAFEHNTSEASEEDSSDDIQVRNQNSTSFSHHILDHLTSFIRPSLTSNAGLER